MINENNTIHRENIPCLKMRQNTLIIRDAKYQMKWTVWVTPRRTLRTTKRNEPAILSTLKFWRHSVYTASFYFSALMETPAINGPLEKWLPIINITVFSVCMCTLAVLVHIHSICSRISQQVSSDCFATNPMTYLTFSDCLQNRPMAYEIQCKNNNTNLSKQQCVRKERMKHMVCIRAKFQTKHRKHSRYFLKENCINETLITSLVHVNNGLENAILYREMWGLNRRNQFSQWAITRTCTCG